MAIILDDLSKSLLKKSSKIVLDDTSKLLLDKAESSPIDQMKAAVDEFVAKAPQQQFDQMAQEEMRLPPQQRNAAINSPAVDTVTGGMSLPQADANASREMANILGLPKAIMGAGNMIKNDMGNDLSRVGNFFNNPLDRTPVAPVPENSQGMADLANVGGNALNFLFGPAIKSARAIGGFAIPEVGKTPLQSMIKDVVQDPGVGVYSQRIGDKTFTGQENPAEQAAKVGMVAAAGTLAELATFDPKKVFKSLTNSSEYTAGIKKQILDSVTEDLPKIKEKLAEQRPDLPKDVIENLTAEHVIVGAQKNPTLGEYLKIKEQDVVANGKKNMYSAQPEELPKPEDVAKLGAPENVIKPIVAGIPSIQPEVKSTIEEHPDGYRLSGLKVPESEQGKGLGTNEVKKLLQKSDETGKPVYLTAVPDKPENQQRLNNFYESLGFKEFKKDPLSGKPMYKYVPNSKSVNLGEIVKDIQSETIQEKTAREIQEFSDMPKGQKTFGFSPDVNQHLKSMQNVAAIQEKLSQQIGAQDVKKIINSNVGIKKASPVVQMTEKSALKRELGQEQKASNQGYKLGRREAISQLKNEYSNKSQELRRENRMQRLKDDIIARDKEAAKIGTLKAKMEAKLENQERQSELQRLQDDIKNRDVSKGDERARKTVIDYIKSSLPVEARGKFLSAVANSKTYGEIIHTFRQVDTHVTNIERKEIIEKLKSVSSKALESGKVAVEYKKMIEDVMGGIELKKRRPETLDRLRRTREHIERQRASGKDVDMPSRILNQLEILNRRSADQLTIGELKNIHSNIEDIVKVGETKLKSRENIYNMEKERISNDLVSGTMALEKNPLIVAEVGEKLTPMQKFQNIFHGINQNLQHVDLAVTPMDTFFDLLDGGHANFDGPNYRHYKAGMDTDYQTYLRKHSEDAESAIRLAHELKLDDQNFERIGVYAMTMQEGGRQKLLDRGMTDKQIDAIILSPNEMKWYKLGRKLLEEVRPEIEETMKNVWNKPLGHVKNYWPMMTDYEKLTDAEIFERFGEGVPDVIHPTKKTAQGFTKTRVGGTQPIKVNAMDVLLKHLDDAHYLVNMSRRIKMLSEIANSPEIKKVAGELGSVLTKEWLDLMARKGGIAGQTRIAILDILRRNFGLAQLGLNVGSALIQPTALLDGAAVIGNHAFDGTYQIITNRDAREFVFNNMPELKARVGDDPAFIDFGDNRFITKMGEVGYAPLKFLDGITANGIAYGAYSQKLKELGVPLDLSKPNKEAIDYAQSIVRQTQSSSLFKDAPPGISRGKITGNKSFDKALFQFQSFVLSRWNTIRNRLWRANLMGGRDSSPGKRDFKKAALIISMLALAWGLEAQIRQGVRKTTDNITGNVSKDKTTVADDMLQSMLTTIPFIGQMVSMAVYKSDSIPSFGGIRKVAEGANSLSTSVKDSIQSGKIKVKPKAIVDFMAGVGSVTGIPGTAQASKLIKSNINSDSKGSAVNLYEQAMRTSDQKERDKLWAQANQISVENRILKEDAQATAEKRIRKEIEDAYEKAILKEDDKDLLAVADKIGTVAKFTDDELDEMYEIAQKRIDRGVKKNKDIEEQSRTYKPRQGMFEEAKKLISSFR